MSSSAESLQESKVNSTQKFSTDVGELESKKIPPAYNYASFLRNFNSSDTAVLAKNSTQSLFKAQPRPDYLDNSFNSVSEDSSDDSSFN